MAEFDRLCRVVGSAWADGLPNGMARSSETILTTSACYRGQRVGVAGQKPAAVGLFAVYGDPMTGQSESREPTLEWPPRGWHASRNRKHPVTFCWD